MSTQPEYNGENKPGTSRFKVLSTKILPAKAVDMLNRQGIVLKQVAFISKQARSFNWQPAKSIRAVFTSTAAVSALQKNNFDFDKIIEAYCVGQKTADLLTRLGVRVAVSASGAAALAHIIADRQPVVLVAFTGNLRRDELFAVLAKNNIAITEKVVYDTQIIPHHLQEDFGHVLFFSPSGVQGYINGYNNRQVTAYCLGPTTAKEARKYFVQVKTAPRPALDELLSMLIADINTHDEQNEKVEK